MKTKELLQRDVKIAMIQKNKEKLLLLRTVLGELDRIGKEVDNDVVDKVVRSMWTTASEMGNTFESEILEPYLLPRMTDEEIDVSVRAIVTMGAYKEVRDIGKVMQEFKEKNTAKPYDGAAVASTIRKWLLN
jgi:uncharacterized protein YqeY